MSASRSKHGHRIVLVWLLLGLTVDLQFCSAALNFTYFDEDHFEVAVDGITIIRHTQASPMMFVGNGRTNFVESKGNFDVNDYVINRMPLSFTVVDYVPGTNDQVPDIELYYDWDYYLKFRLSETEDQRVMLEVYEVSGTFDRVWLRLVAEPDERVYGGGEQFSYFNLRGRSYPIWIREQGVGRNKSTLETFWADRDGGAGGDYYTTYFSQPTFLSSRNYMFHHEGSHYAELDFSHDDFHEVHVLGVPGRVYLTGASQPATLVSQLTSVLGRQPPLPDWVYTGAILGIQGGTQMMRGYLTQAEAYSIPVSGVWIQDWVGRITTSFGRRLFWDWHWNQEQYPDLPAEISRLREKGIRVLGYINPYLHQEGELFKVADANGYFVKNTTNQTYISDFGEFYCGTIDLTNPAAYDWYKNDVIKKNMIEFGFGGWMADFGEYLPAEGVEFYSGQHPEELHNEWPVLWAKLNREAVEESGKLGDVMFWMRAGYSGTGNYSLLMWAGDQNVDFSLSDGIASTVPAALSMGVSGVGLTHFDIGGFTTFAAFTPPLVRTEQCLLRSAEMAVFTPVFRTHEGNQPRNSVQFYSSRSTMTKFARLARMFASLQNYRRHVVNLTATTGLPAQRPLFLHYPSDPQSYDVTYQYMFGPDLLVAPVYLPDVESWDVYLPPDPEATWVFLWDGSARMTSGGQTVKVSAPLGQPPVFYRNTSVFVPDFMQLTAEPLVDIPPYIPDDYFKPDAGAEPDQTPCGSAPDIAPSRLASLVAFAVAFLRM